MRRPRRLSRPARSERIRSRGDTPWGSRSRRGTLTRRPSAVTTTAMRLRLRPWKKSKRPDSNRARPVTGVRSVAAHARGTQPPNRNDPRRGGRPRRRQGGRRRLSWLPAGCAPGCGSSSSPGTAPRRRRREVRRREVPVAGHRRGLAVAAFATQADQRGTAGPRSRPECRLNRVPHRGLRVPDRSIGAVAGSDCQSPVTVSKSPHKRSLLQLHAMPTPEFEAAVRRATRRRHTPRSPRTSCASARTPGVSRARLAAEAGVDRRYLDRIEAGHGTAVDRDVPAPRLGAGRRPEHEALRQHRAGDPRPAPGADAGADPPARAIRAGGAFTEVAVRSRAGAGSTQCCTSRASGWWSQASCSRSCAGSNRSSAGRRRRPSRCRAGTAGRTSARSRSSAA